MKEVLDDGIATQTWTQEEVELLKCLILLKLPIDMISEELDRSWTATSLKVIELRLPLFS